MESNELRVTPSPLLFNNNDLVMMLQ